MGQYVIKDGASFAQAMKAIRDKLNVKVENTGKEVVKAVTDIAMDCLDRSVQRAPVDTGTLRGSGYARVNGSEVAHGNDSGITVSGAPDGEAGPEVHAEVGFSEVYALRQHEHTEYNHPMGGQAKYLESVVAENIDRYNKHIQDAAKKGLRGEET